MNPKESIFTGIPIIEYDIQQIKKHPINKIMYCCGTDVGELNNLQEVVTIIKNSDAWFSLRIDEKSNLIVRYFDDIN